MKIRTACWEVVVGIAIMFAVRDAMSQTVNAQTSPVAGATPAAQTSAEMSARGVNATAQSAGNVNAAVQSAGNINSAAQSANQSAALPLFGENFFTSPGREGMNAGQASDRYVLGAGDQLAIHLGGKAQQDFQTAVTADGKIYLPTVGVLSVQGLTLAQARELLDLRLRRLYSYTTLDLVLLSVKSVRVAVTGDVHQPGNYTLSALQSVLDAVSLAGGPTGRGSLRDIQVYRGEELVAHIDLYTHLLKPGQSADVLLQSGDKIFVPPSRMRVQIIGEILRPAIYELAPGQEDDLAEVITLAGGFTDLAYRAKIEFSRMQPDGSRKISYFDLTGPDTLALPVLANMDRICVYSVKDQIPYQTVTIQGEVNHPGAYEWEEGMRLSDLILKAGSPTRSAWLLKAEVAEVDPNLPPRIKTVDLERLLKSREDSLDLLLGPDDQVFIRRIPDWRVGPLVEVRGEVTFPGYYPIVDDSTLLSEVMKQCGGLTADAQVSEAKLVRMLQTFPEDKEYERLSAIPRDQLSDREYEYLVMKQNSSDARQIVIDFYKLLRWQDKSQDVVLRDGDLIVVPKTPGVVQVSGRVDRPGGVIYKPGARFRYYINQAGGFSWDADGRRAKVIKASGDIVDDEDARELLPGDRIWVPRKPDRNFWRTFRDVILVAGQVATIYLVIQNATE